MKGSSTSLGAVFRSVNLSVVILNLLVILFSVYLWSKACAQSIRIRVRRARSDWRRGDVPRLPGRRARDGSLRGREASAPPPERGPGERRAVPARAPGNTLTQPRAHRRRLRPRRVRERSCSRHGARGRRYAERGDLGERASRLAVRPGHSDATTLDSRGLPPKGCSTP